MGAVWLLSMADWIRDAGIVVHEHPGWPLRSRGSGGFDRSPMALVVHHDAFPAGFSERRRVEIEYDEAEFAPVGNLHLHTDGSVTVGAAGASNTAGRGGPAIVSGGEIAENMANRLSLNIEASNDGVGEPWTVEQIAVYPRLCRVLCDRLGLDPLTDILSHVEWTEGVPAARSPRKIDPAGPSPWTGSNRWQTWDMDRFRETVATIGDDEMLIHEPRRVIDTRNATPGVPDGGGRLIAHVPRRLPVVFGSSAHVVIQVIRPASAGWLEIQPTNEALTGDSAPISWDAGDRVSVGLPVLAPEGHVWVRASTDCDLIIETCASGR